MAYGHMNMIFYMLLKIWFTNHSFPSEISVPLLQNLLMCPGVVFSRLQTRPPNLLAQASFITADSILAWLQLNTIYNKSISVPLLGGTPILQIGNPSLTEVVHVVQSGR